MIFANEALDDPIVDDGCVSFAGGMVSNMSARMLKDDQVALLQNFDLTRIGQVQIRRGSSRLGTDIVSDGTAGPWPATSLIAGMRQFDTPTYSYLIAMNAGHPWRWSGAAWVRIIGYTSTAARVSMAQGVNVMYFADGAQNIHSWDGAAFTDLGSGGVNNPPANPSSIVWHTSRLVAAGIPSEPDAIHFSQFLMTVPAWDTANWVIRVGAGDGDPIKGIVSWTGHNLLVIKRHSLWMVDADPETPPADFHIRKIHGQIGSLAPNTFVQVGSDIFGLTDSGVRSMKRTLASETQAEFGESLSEPIENMIRRINPAAIHKCTATYWDNRYMLSVPLDAATEPDYVFVYNTLTDSWSGYWTGWNATCFSTFIDTNSSLRLVFGRSTGHVHKWLDKEIDNAFLGNTYYTDEGVDYDTIMVTRAMSFGQPRNDKTGFSLEIEYSSFIASGTIEIEAALDGEQAQLYGPLENVEPGPVGTAVSTSSTVYQREAFGLQQYGRFRDIQFRLTSTLSAPIIRRVHASAFVETAQLQGAS